MITTPICDFVKAYRDSKTLRLHMPGHKGHTFIGPEGLDITEIDGADVLYSANGVIRESEENASALFGTGRTLYSAEGSSLCIRAMLYLVMLYARETGRRPVIAAARNAHKVFMTTAALLDIEIRWLFPQEASSVVSCCLSMDETERVLREEKPAALYVTSPDYLGNLADVQALSRLCHETDTLLVVDNAHGAYLKFLPASRHPMDLGADMCCDSAHKTLPVLTGGAYLHIAKRAPQLLRDHAANAMALFASTSPSYLILQSLDAANRYLANGYAERLADLSRTLGCARARLAEYEFDLAGDEAMKLTIAPKNIGWRGDELARYLMRQGVSIEFSDPDFLVMMFTPEISETEAERVTGLLCSVEKKTPRYEKPPVLGKPIRRLCPRDALFSPQELLPVEQAVGRVLASASVTCPPAVPIVVCGEVIDEMAVKCFRYYGIESCFVTKE